MKKVISFICAVFLSLSLLFACSACGLSDVNERQAKEIAQDKFNLDTVLFAEVCSSSALYYVTQNGEPVYCIDEDNSDLSKVPTCKYGILVMGVKGNEEVLILVYSNPTMNPIVIDWPFNKSYSEIVFQLYDNDRGLTVEECDDLVLRPYDPDTWIGSPYTGLAYESDKTLIKSLEWDAPFLLVSKYFIVVQVNGELMIFDTANVLYAQ